MITTNFDVLAPLTRMGFNETERRHLLTSPGLGPVVVQRLEDAGVISMASLRRMGVDAVVLAMCQPGTNLAWCNRRRALRRALETYGH